MSQASQARCEGVTKSGKRCKNYAQPGSTYCHLHNTAASTPHPDDELAARKKALLAELDELVADLKATLPETGTSPYSPLQFLSFLRQNLGQLAPDVQLGILENFQDMSREDLLDMDTWKGMAYMLSYSARFQAGQLKEKMNEQLPKPLQPDTVLDFVKQNVDRFTPDVAKGIVDTFQGATREDLTDPDTWKGVWYMLNYSLQFQANQLKQRVLGESDESE
jgi:hypothetical protein